MKIFLAACTILVALTLAGGCSTKKPKEEAGAGVGEPGAAGAEGRAGGVTTEGLAGRGGWTAADLNDPNSPLYAKVIYFDLDQSDIKPEYVDTLRAHAVYLGGNPQARVTLEGHGDERGTREYNLALGEQRSYQVLRFLAAEGVDEAQIQTISYGEERPSDTGHHDAAWALNRRVVLVY